MSTIPAFTADWVQQRFGVSLAETTPPGEDHAEGNDTDGNESAYRLDQLVILGLRRNKRRAHLLVSTVLGKHIPTPPRQVRGAADALGDAVIAAIGASAAAQSTVLGFAETATGLGHCVAHRLGAEVYLHSTRRHLPGVTVAGSFEEGHSHATTHLLQPRSAELMSRTAGAPLLLVDDEISTGSTALQAISQLHQIFARDHYVVASLIDLRDETHRQKSVEFATELGIRIDYVALATGHIELPEHLTDEVWALTADPLNPVAANGVRGHVTEVALAWPPEVPDGGRYGILSSETDDFLAAASTAATYARAHLDPDREVVVVGHEELMYLPLVIAEELADAGLTVRYQTTTRSPAHVNNSDGYPLRRGFTFTAPESDPGTPRFIYNIVTPGNPDQTPPQVLLVIDSPADTPQLRADGGLLDVLTAAGHDVVLAIVAASDQQTLAKGLHR